MTNVVLFDLETDGIATVRYSTEDGARACVGLMDGRHFSGMTVKAMIADGSEKFKKTSEKKAALDDSDEESGNEEKRLNQFGEWLEEEAGK